MRNRTVQLNIRLTKAENNQLKIKSRKAGLNVSAYIHMLISGYLPKETSPIEYNELIKSITELNSKLPGTIDSEEFHRLILKLRSAVTLPEEIKFTR